MSTGLYMLGKTRFEIDPERPAAHLVATPSGRMMEMGWYASVGPRSRWRHSLPKDACFRMAALLEAPLVAALAQLVEHIIRNDGVTGSSPVSGTIPGQNWAPPRRGGDRPERGHARVRVSSRRS